MYKARKIGVGILEYAVMLFTIAVSVFPIIWVVMSAFKTNAQILSNPFELPTQINFDAFVYIFEKYNFVRYFGNSLLICIVSTAISLVIFAMGGYVIAKYNFPGKNVMFALFTITLLVPAQSKAQPIFSLVTDLNLYDNIWGVALVYLSMGLAMSMFILKATFMAIPKSLDEAASLEGAGFFTTFWKINFPLQKAALQPLEF